MAFDKLILKNPNTGETKMAPVGFSWTTLFFGGFVSLFRTDWIMALVQFGVAIFTFGLSNIVFAFIYNKLYIKSLIFKEGFKAAGTAKGNIDFVSNKLGLELPRI